jgi:hypothetical protein
MHSFHSYMQHTFMHTSTYTFVHSSVLRCRCSLCAGTFRASAGCRRSRGAGGSRQGDALTYLYSVVARSLSLLIRVVRCLAASDLWWPGSVWLPGSKCERGGSARRGGRVVARPVCGVLSESRDEFDVVACVGRHYVRGLICAALCRRKQRLYAQPKTAMRPKSSNW